MVFESEISNFVPGLRSGCIERVCKGRCVLLALVCCLSKSQRIITMFTRIATFGRACSYPRISLRVFFGFSMTMCCLLATAQASDHHYKHGYSAYAGKSHNYSKVHRSYQKPAHSYSSSRSYAPYKAPCHNKASYPGTSLPSYGYRSHR
jgi:hypothetical protein